MKRKACKELTKALKILLCPTEKPKMRVKYLSTGYPPLDLGCTDKLGKGLKQGRYYLFIGDSNAGKTFLVLEILAQAAMNPDFDDYDLVLDEPEEGAEMDFTSFYGANMALRTVPPSKDKKGKAVYSRTIEQFYYHLELRRRSGRPFIYILDSMDVLGSEDENKKVEENIKAYERTLKGNVVGKVKGSYGDGKAKKNSTSLRRILKYLHDTGSILIILSQTRDNIGFGAMFNPKTRSGGHALKFYCGLEFWMSVREQIRKKVRGKNRSQGIRTEIHIKKNRQTGRDLSIYMPIYWSFGIDVIGGMIHYLIDEDHWKGSDVMVKAPEFDFSGKIEKLVRTIDGSKALEKKLRLLVRSVWLEIKEACSVKRKQRHE